MTVKSGQTLAWAIVCTGSTGALATPSVGPVGALYVAGVATADVVTITGANPYKWSVTLPVLTAGQTVQIYITATIGGIATAGFVFADVGDTSLSSDLAVTLAAVKAKTDLITTGTALTVVSAISGSIMTLSMTASYSATITGLTIPTTWTKLWWTLKATAEDADSSAILQLIVSNPAAGATDGVLYVMGAAATVAQRTLGDLTVDQGAGTVAVALDETLTAVLRASSGFVWDVKCLESGGDATILTTGAANIARTVTRAVV